MCIEVAYCFAGRYCNMFQRARSIQPTTRAGSAWTLLRAKQNAMDRGVPFSLPQDELCSRCQGLFATLDLARDVCVELSQGGLPAALQEVLAQQHS